MKARYNKVYEEVSEFINEQSMITYPLDFEKLKSLIEGKGWFLVPYKSTDEDYKISHDGYSKYIGNDFYIHYNIENINERICFTLGHEIGHIILNHHFEFKEHLLCSNPNVNKAIEQEADVFSRNLLCPAPIVEYVRSLGYFVSAYDVTYMFNISMKCAKVRMEEYLFNQDLQNVVVSKHKIESAFSSKFLDKFLFWYFM